MDQSCITLSDDDEIQVLEQVFTIEPSFVDLTEDCTPRKQEKAQSPILERTQSPILEGALSPTLEGAQSLILERPRSQILEKPLSQILEKSQSQIVEPKPFPAPDHDSPVTSESSDDSQPETFSSPQRASTSTPTKPASSRKKKRLKTSSTPKLVKMLQKKLEREQVKKLKQKQKEGEKLEKEANRANAANKALNNCIAKVHGGILRIIDDPEEITLRTLFDESMITYEIEQEMLIENSITWTYKRTEIVDENCVVRYADSKWLMVIMPGVDYLKQLLIYKKDSNDFNSLKTFLINLRTESQCDIVLVVFNLANHLRSERAKEAKNYRKTFKDKFEGRTNSANANAISTNQTNDETFAIGTTELQDLRLALEMEIKQQLKDLKLHIEFHEKTAEVIQAIVRFTCSLAKLQVKQKIRSSTGLDWAINMDKERAVDPTKSSEDLTRLWITQLQQFSQVTLPIAKAIAAEYPSPFALLDQYKNLRESEAEDLLGQLYVQRNLKRQIGPNISRRIHCFMTCEDPNVHIGLS